MEASIPSFGTANLKVNIAICGGEGELFEKSFPSPHAPSPVQKLSKKGRGAIFYLSYFNKMRFVVLFTMSIAFDEKI